MPEHRDDEEHPFSANWRDHTIHMLPEQYDPDEVWTDPQEDQRHKRIIKWTITGAVALALTTAGLFVLFTRSPYVWYFDLLVVSLPIGLAGAIYFLVRRRKSERSAVHDDHPPDHSTTELAAASQDRSRAGNGKPDRTLVLIVIGYYLILAAATGLAFFIWFPAFLAVGTFFVLQVLLHIGLWLIRGPIAEAERKVMQEVARAVEPSARSAATVIRGEIVKVETREHKIVLLWRVFPLVLIALAAAWFVLTFNTGSVNELVLLGILAILVLIPSWRWLHWFQLVNDFTNYGIFQVTGVITPRSRRMSMRRMAEVELITPWFSLLLTGLRIIKVPFGHMEVSTPVAKQELKGVYYIPAVTAVYKVVMGDAYGVKDSEEM